MKIIAMPVASILVCLTCTGCVVGYKPPSPTILHLTQSPPAGGGAARTIDFGLNSVIWNRLQSGYGLAGEGPRPRAHEGYLYLFYDPDVNRPGRYLLVTPVRIKGLDEPVYRLQIVLPVAMLDPSRKEFDGQVLLEGNIVSRPVETDKRVQFDVQDIRMTVKAQSCRGKPPPASYRLTGRIVAEETGARDFEMGLSGFNSEVSPMESQQ